MTHHLVILTKGQSISLIKNEESYLRQVQGVDIVVGVPGKLCGLLDSKSLDLSQIRFFVLDEADALAFGENYQMVSQLARHLVSVI